MKKFLFLFLVASLLFTSCKKEDITPINQEIEEVGTIEEGILIYGEWKLLSGKMYVHNLETNQNTVYDHFDVNKTTSSLRYSGSQFEFETIRKDSTTWTFIAPPNWQGYGEFWLDNDSIQPYGFYVLDNFWSIVEHPTATTSTSQLGGSSRPITAVVTSYSNQTVEFTVQEVYESIDGYNCKYYSILTFQKQ